MRKCEICGEKEAKHKCAYCRRLFCDDCGAFFYQEKKWICYECWWKSKIRERMDKLFLKKNI